MTKWLLYWNGSYLHAFEPDDLVSLCKRVKRTSWADETVPSNKTDRCWLCCVRQEDSAANA